MKRLCVLSLGTLTLALTGCSSSNIVGTWNGRGAGANAPFTFGSVSFVGDKTFTAESRYPNNVRVQSGTWSTSGDKLTLNAEKMERNYTYKVDKKELIVTDPKTGHSITLDRLAK